MDQPKKKSVVKKTNYSNYNKVKGHPNFYQNEESKRIIFKKKIGAQNIKIATGAIKITDAKRIVDERLLVLLSHNPKADKRKKLGVSNPSLEEMWNELVEEKTPSSEPHTLENYNTSSRHGFGPFWFSKTVADVNQANQIAFENWYLKNRGTKDYYNTRKHLRMLFNFLFRNKMISEVPVFKDLAPVIAKKTKRKPVGRVYTDEEFAAMLKACGEVSEDPIMVLKLEIYLLMGRHQGRRDRESLNSEWSNLNFKTGLSEVWSQKNKKWREIPMTKDLSERLLKLRKLTHHGKYVFPMDSDENRPIASQVINGYWAEIKEIASIANHDVKNAARYHDLRHSFATQTTRDRWPIITACKMLDMTVKEYQRTYTHIEGSDINVLMKESFGGLK